MKTLIAIPIRQLHPHTAECLHRDLSRGYSFVSVEKCPYIDMARGLLAERVLQILTERPDHDVVAFIDEDMRWEPSDLDVLTDICRVVREDHGISPLLHATYAMRGDSGDTCHRRAIAEHGTPQPRDLVIQRQKFPAVTGGLGFCVIHRDGFLKFASHCKKYVVPSMGAMALDMFPTGVVDGRWYGEDVLHCVRQFDHGYGSYWVQPMVVEHMASTYGPPLALRLPSHAALERLRGDTQPCPPDPEQHRSSNQEQHDQHTP